jgi:hypothetical protein
MACNADPRSIRRRNQDRSMNVTNSSRQLAVIATRPIGAAMPAVATTRDAIEAG